MKIPKQHRIGIYLVLALGVASYFPPSYDVLPGTPATQAATLELLIRHDEDDKGQDGSVIDVTGSIDLWAGDEWGAFRFQNVHLPQGATINSAILKIYPFDTDDDDANVFLDFQQVDHAPALTNTANDISNRWTDTDNKVTWQQNSLGTGQVSSPELKNALQAIIDRPGWTLGNAIVLLLDHTGSNIVDLEITGYGENPAKAARLAIDYTALTLSGRVYEDVDGDGDVLNDGVGAPNVRVLLYQDDGSGDPDAGDTFLISTRTDSNGQYTFDVGDGTYWVVIDSKTISPDAGFNSRFAPSDVWAEQTYGAAGSTSSDGATFSFSGSAGSFFGGMQGEVADDTSALSTSEHVIRVIISGSNATGVDAGFSFNTITNTTDSSPIDPFTLTASWSTFDAGAAGIGTDPDGYSEAVYDGRYVYFVPHNNGSTFHGELLRYDTGLPPNRQAAWTTFDPGAAGVGTDPDGYAGGIYDGRYVYFAPWRSGTSYHGEVLRYDTQSAFHTTDAWDTFDPGAAGLGTDPDGYEGIEFDGRYLYFAPYNNGTKLHSEVLRYDTQSAFNNVASWAVFDPFAAGVTTEQGGYDGVETDGRYIYFVPLEDGGGPHGEMLRYDTQADFSNAASWEAFDPGANGIGTDADGYAGAIFDGRYLYYVPLHNGTDFHGEVLRYDTQAVFSNVASWTAFDPGANGVGSIGVGYLDPTFDGRYVYFSPYLNSLDHHGEVMRYDTRGPFTSTASWTAFNPGAAGVGTDPRGYWGAVFDGRYVHLVPIRIGSEEHGEVLILDTAPGGGGQGSARQFLLNSNAIVGTNSSQFAIPTSDSGYNGTGNGEYTITPVSAWPTLIDPLILDGTTQTGFVDQPIIEINGASAGAGVNGLTITAGGSTAKGLVINRFLGYGIALTTNGGDTIQGNFIGTHADGDSPLLNATGGLLIDGSDSNTVGGASATTRNVISGNEPVGINIINGSMLNVIQGNFIGTNVKGTIGLANIGHGIIIDDSPNNTIGGTASKAGNVISDNDDGGILITGSSATGNQIQGNFIGTDVTGIAPLGNASYGVFITNSASDNTIGGTAAGAGNTIAYNLADGVFVQNGIRNAIRANTIFENTGLGIDLAPNGVGAGSGANSDQMAPTIDAITPSGADFIVVATVTSGDTIEFFRANNTVAPTVSTDPAGYGEGYLLLGSCVDNGVCAGPHISAVADADPTAGIVQATLLSSGLTINDIVSATTTDANGNTSEFGAFLFTTAVTLNSFTATGQGAEVLVSWETAQELRLWGFHLYRGPSAEGPFTRLTDSLISASLFSTTGQLYVYRDTQVTAGELYYYQLEEVDVDGSRTIYGPIRVSWDIDSMPDD